MKIAPSTQASEKANEEDLIVEAMGLIPKQAIDSSWYVPIATLLAVVFSIGLLDALERQDRDWTEDQALRMLEVLNSPDKIERMRQILVEFNFGVEIAPGSKEHMAAKLLAKAELVEEEDNLWRLTNLGQTLLFRLNNPKSISGAKEILEGEIV